MFLSLIALLVQAWALAYGFRLGTVRQVPRVIGLLVGIVCAHVFCEPAANAMADAFPGVLGRTESTYILTTAGCGLVFTAVYLVFRYATVIVVWPFRGREPGIPSRLGGAVISWATWLMFLSLAYNAAVCVSPRSELMRAMRSSDGNIVEEVLMAAPAVLGSQSPEELRHQQQLEDARSIS